MIANAVASPAPAAAPIDRPKRHQNATAQSAAGTSDIGSRTMRWTVGLVATSHAAINPASGDPIRSPIPYVAATSSAPQIGTTQKTAQCPATNLAPAMSNGSPGAYVGTMAQRSRGWCGIGGVTIHRPGPGRYASGVKLHVRFGHGTASTHGCEIDSRPLRKRSAWLT